MVRLLANRPFRVRAGHEGNPRANCQKGKRSGGKGPEAERGEQRPTRAWHVPRRFSVRHESAARRLAKHESATKRPPAWGPHLAGHESATKRPPARRPCPT